MNYTTLGNTSLKVSKICLGTMTFGQQNTEAEAHEQLFYSVEQGINFIDTAELYPVPACKETQGSTERIIGSWLNKRKQRDKLVIASKVASPWPGLTHIRNPLRFDKAQITEALNNSLQRLQTDYVDLYQLHWPERKTNFFGQLGYVHSTRDSWKDNFLEILEIFQSLIREGKIRFFGISNETPWGLMHFLQLAQIHQLPSCVSIQNPYNLLNRTFEVGLAEMAIRENTGLLAYSPMAFGLLSGKYHKWPRPKNSRISLFPTMARYNGALAYKATEKYLKIAEKHGLTLAQMSLAFVNSRPFLTSNIIGATTMQQLKENIETHRIQLSEEVLKEIEEVHLEIPNPAP